MNFLPEKRRKKGFAAFFVTILVIIIMIVIGGGMTVLIISELKMLRNITDSTKAYYMAEAGIEDGLLRLRRGMSWSSPYDIVEGEVKTSVSISDKVGGARIITSTGDFLSRIRRVQAVYAISTTDVSFHYGAQVGEGGMTMANNSRVLGNVYSNGNITPAGGGVGYIDDTVIVAQNGNVIDSLVVGGDAYAYSCIDCNIDGDLTYSNSGVNDGCTVAGSVTTQDEEIPAEPLPVSQEKVDDWKLAAEEGGVIMGDYEVAGGEIERLGPVKIDGSMLVDNNSTLIMTGVIWITGDLRVDNGSTIELDRNSYGSLSGVMVVDGRSKFKPGTVLKGSGEEGSYLMLLSTNTELVDTADPAIEVGNNCDSAIFYTTQGLIVLLNNINAREVTGYKIHMANNAEISYESGLEKASFVSGPGGSWEVTGWKEVE